jgi:hypothetical protein
VSPAAVCEESSPAARFRRDYPSLYLASRIGERLVEAISTTK